MKHTIVTLAAIKNLMLIVRKQCHLLSQVLCAFSIIFLITFSACQTETKRETPSTEKPYCLEIKKERSYYQALKICDRLQEMDYNAYVVSETDTIDGAWYKVYCGALAHKDSLMAYQNRIKSQLDIDSIKFVNILEKDTFCIINKEDTSIVKERRRIKASHPLVDSAVIRTICKYPNSNAFYNDRIQIFDIGEKQSNFINARLDLPLGISKKDIIKEMHSFSEVCMTDNLSGNSITLQVMERNKKELLKNSDFLRAWATKIIERRQCEHQLDSIAVDAFTTLTGWRLTLHLPDVNRYYYLLTGNNRRYAYICQSVDYSDTEILRYLSKIGKSNGLNEYDEFYNTFYLCPSRPMPEDIFLGYSLFRLNWGYAKSKGYTKWSKEMVGHWGTQAYYYNRNKGLWTFGVYDLNTIEKNNYVESLYLNYLGNKRETADVYGVKANVIRQRKSLWSRKRYVSEINFPITRYVCMVDNNSDYSLNTNDLIRRAERLQFTMDGYVQGTE
ncbi:MAG: hypothetical protein N4A74_14410 [Carboxylicivirga sp.]|jgi:hypothetical protein|nr:hypothetical protein [Carboxylicivirga sp.]